MPVTRLRRAVPTGLRKRLLFLVLACVLPFLLLIGMAARRHFLNQKPVAADRARVRARDVADHLDARFAAIESVMRAVTIALNADPASRPANDTALRTVARSYPDYVAQWDLFSSGGQLIGSSSLDAGSREHLQAAWVDNQTEDVPVTEPANAQRDGWIVHKLLPMRDRRGNRALLVARIRLNSLRALLVTPDLPAGSSIAVISAQGIIVGRSPNPDVWVGYDISGTPLDSVIRLSGNGVTEFMTQDSVKRVIAVTRMNEAPWLVGAGIPASVVFAQARQDFGRAIGYGGLALLLALLFASWQASRIIDPLTRLSADAAKLGTGDLAHRSRVLGKDELGVLAATINEMATTLEQQGAVLRESESRYRELFDINPLPMWVFDPETLAFLAVNRSAIEVYGYSEAEFLAMKVSDIRPAEDVPEFVTYLRETGEKTRKNKRRHKRKDGSLLEVEIDSGVISFDGRPARLVVSHDVSERVRAEEALRDAEVQLRQSQRLEAIGQLTGGIAHDFNNVLTAILSYSDFLHDSLDAGDARRLDIQEIRKAADRAAGLTKQLLAFSRSQILQPRVIDVNESLGELEQLLKRLLTAEVELVFDLAPDIGHVRADPGQLTQVVINLAVNARDAMPEGGVLTISSRNERVTEAANDALSIKPDVYVAITVADTGTGMDRDTMQRIFEPFFTTKNPGKGTGLGLSTVHGIVHQSGGYICADSEPGQGTTFTIRLPRVHQPVEPEQPHPERAVVGHRGEVILVVEDEEAVRRAARRILVNKGYTVLEAADGNEGVRMIETHPQIDLLLTDLVMPGMGGRELVRVLREMRLDIPTLYMSGYTKDAVMRSELDPGIMVLEKPFSQDELAAKVREVLDGAVTSD